MPRIPVQLRKCHFCNDLRRHTFLVISATGLQKDRVRSRTLRMIRRLLALSVCLAALAPLARAADDSAAMRDKLDRELRARADAPRGHSRVIIRFKPNVRADALIRSVRGT